MSEADRRTPTASSPGRGRAPRLRGITLPMWVSRWWLLVLLLALTETAALAVRIKRVPPASDWVAAADFVRERFERGDAITSAPQWTDPTLRLHLGDKINLKIAGRSDLASFERLWVLAIRGARAEDAPPRAPDLERSFGRVQVRRYDFGPSPEVLDLVDALPQAQVTLRKDGVDVPCRFNPRARSRATGGLFFGPVSARQRFQCDHRKPWLHVGVTVMEDLDLQPRRCIWQHPAGDDPVSVTYEDVHLGNHLVLYGGLYYHHERERQRGPVFVRVRVDGREVATLVHEDGDGFERWQVDTLKGRPPDAPPRGDLRIEVTAPNPHLRSFCWSGSIRDAVRREAP